MESFKRFQAIHSSPERQKKSLENYLQALAQSDLPIQEAVMSYALKAKPRFLPPKVLPCANINPSQYFACNKPGTKTCSSCKLVSYCSKECQTTNWMRHKKDCKATIRSDKWEPAWRTEGRPPMFIVDTEEDDLNSLSAGEFNGGCTLWGNMPAIDLLNLSKNEIDTAKDFNLAFVASGDLRNVMKTVNSLPPHYSGKLDILINDKNPAVTSRNLVLLLILGTLPDEDTAVDAALHFWYSAFMPAEYHMQMCAALNRFLRHLDDEPAPGPFALGGDSTLSVHGSPTSMPMLYGFFQRYISSSSISMDEAQIEYDRVRSAPSRRDFRDRMYAGLTKSHRLAFFRYRQHGIVIPFGAMNAHFNYPNASLFFFNNQWLQTDHSDPLAGWDLTEIIARGNAHGAQEEDIYGCLYFFLTEQLRTFARRIRSFRISFKLFALKATEELSADLKRGRFRNLGLPASIRFDRIEVSNIIDANYVGLREVVDQWGPLLAKQRNAVLVGYFMNWFLIHKNGRACGADPAAFEKAMKRFSLQRKNAFKESMTTPGSMEAAMSSMMQNIDVVYDNSAPFASFLTKQGLHKWLNDADLQLRRRHKVVPPRLLVPIEAAFSALPDLQDEKMWYRYTNMDDTSWAARFVEIANK